MTPRRSTVPLSPGPAGGLARAILALAAAALAWGAAPADLRAQELPRFDGLRPPFVAWQPPTPAPDLVWRDGRGEDRRLSALHGRPVLVAFWATWCAPCVAEMPTLDALAEAMDGRLAVVPIALDEGGVSAVRRFYDRHGIDSLPVAVDPLGNTAYASDDWRRPGALPLFGLPMTWFVNAEGRLVGYVAGSADWADDGARDLLKRLFGG